MASSPPYRRTVAVINRLFGSNISKREFILLNVLIQAAGIAVGVAAFLTLPTPALIVLVGLMVAGVIWMVAVARAYGREPR